VDSGTNAPSKQDMMAMLRFGAERIIASKESTVTDESIDEILARSKVRTDELNEKLSSMEEDSLRNFTIEAPAPAPTSFPVYSCHDFEGIDYKYIVSAQLPILNFTIHSLL